MRHYSSSSGSNCNNNNNNPRPRWEPSDKGRDSPTNVWDLDVPRQLSHPIHDRELPQRGRGPRRGDGELAAKRYQTNGSSTQYANNYVTRLVIPNVQRAETAGVLVGVDTNGKLVFRTTWIPSRDPS